MAENEKCFCHLNGYKVKDADARAAIAEQQTQINANAAAIAEQQTQNDANTAAIGVNTQRMDDLEHLTNDHGETISALQTGLEETDTALRAYVDEKIGSALEGSY